MIERLLRPGHPTVADVDALRRSELYRRMEAFSNGFLGRHREALGEYGQKWSDDPFHAWSREWEYPFVDFHLPSTPGLKLLDAGSGATFFSFWLAQRPNVAHVTALDYDDRWTALYERFNRSEELPVEFVAADMGQMPFPDAMFDVVTCVSVLEHLPQRSTAIHEIERVLKPGGRFVMTFDLRRAGDHEISLPNAQAMVAELDERLSPRQDSAAVVQAAADDPKPLTAGIREAERLTPKRADYQLKLWIKRNFRPQLFYDLAVVGLVYEKRS